MDIIKKFGLQAVEIEPQIFKIINTDKEVDIHKLKQQLGPDIAILRSSTLKQRKIGNTIEELEHIYYILPKQDKLIDKYKEIAKQEHSEVVVDYILKMDALPSIDTLYTLEELGL